MTSHIAFIWEGPVLFTRLFEDCGISCELVTPHLLAAPFFRKKFNGIVIPAGFASEQHIRILTALRAISSRIDRYVKEGGTILAFGGGADKPSAYDWLSPSFSYNFGFSEEHPVRNHSHPCASIIEEETDTISIDGTLEGIQDKELVILNTEKGPVLIHVPYGKGKIVVSTIHEYPSRTFITGLFAHAGEGLL
ncbi:MAG: hypothetical protein GXY48_06900 [Methanomicrobiales archaeon]|nr:hypothetical protein [Methanomicrobiales archaeon]